MGLVGCGSIFTAAILLIYFEVIFFQRWSVFTFCLSVGFSYFLHSQRVSVLYLLSSILLVNAVFWQVI